MGLGFLSEGNTTRSSYCNYPNKILCFLVWMVPSYNCRNKDNHYRRHFWSSCSLTSSNSGCYNCWSWQKPQETCGETSFVDKIMKHKINIVKNVYNFIVN